MIIVTHCFDYRRKFCPIDRNRNYRKINFTTLKVCCLTLNKREITLNRIVKYREIFIVTGV